MNELVIPSELQTELARAETVDDAVVGMSRELAKLDIMERAKVETAQLCEQAERALIWQRHAGKKLAALERGKPKPYSKAEYGSEYRAALERLQIPSTTAHRWQRIASAPDDLFDELVQQTRDAADVITASRLLRAIKDLERDTVLEENIALVSSAEHVEELSGIYSAVLIDPPWDWGDEGDVSQFGRGRPTYNTITFPELKELPVSELAADDAHLYLWITNRSLPKGFELIDAWGFRYVTCITWVKPHFGMGNYFRGQTEHILFGVRGSLPLKRRNVGTVFHANRGPGGHSSKPPEVYDLIESCSPGPYLELFSRQEREGWVMWGENGTADNV